MIDVLRVDLLAASVAVKCPAYKDDVHRDAPYTDSYTDCYLVMTFVAMRGFDNLDDGGLSQVYAHGCCGR